MADWDKAATGKQCRIAPPQMRAKQLHLFEVPSPLLARVGESFFRTAPREPGVYIMTGRNESVLYVGQSRNLRVRLASYKNARPDRTPRKVIRLLSQVEKIVWEKCRTEDAARLRENQLLRLHRPKFNSMNVWPKAYSFLWLARRDGALQFGRTREPEQRELLFGAFKGGAFAGFAAMLRLTWAAVNQPQTLFQIPRQLLQSRPPREFGVSIGERSPVKEEELLELCRAFLAGQSADLLKRLESLMPLTGAVSRAQSSLHIQDLETLKLFFQTGPGRNRRLQEQQGFSSPFIPQEELDDLIALNGPSRQGRL